MNIIDLAKKQECENCAFASPLDTEITAIGQDIQRPSEIFYNKEERSFFRVKETHVIYFDIGKLFVRAYINADWRNSCERFQRNKNILRHGIASIRNATRNYITDRFTNCHFSCTCN
jgi:hypothetical protein